MGGRGAGLNTADAPTPAGGRGKTQWGQPNTPVVVPAASIRKQIGTKGSPISATKAVKTINPDHSYEYGDYSENCQRCVVAYELNRRGYKVEASETYEKDPLPYMRNWSNAFKNPKFTKVGAKTTAGVNKNILSEMKSWGEGSRAIVKINKGNNGHVFNVEYHNGKLYYYDAQVGVKYRTSTVFDNSTRSQVEIMRSDNLDLAQQITKMVRKKRR